MSSIANNVALEISLGNMDRETKQKRTFQAAYAEGYVHSGANKCECYGLINGCDCDCPMFLDGDCKTVYDEPELFIEMIERCNPNKDTLDEIYDAYPQLKIEEDE